MSVRIVGRSSSHFTRTVRMFAHECTVAYEFQPLFDLMSQSPADYAGNPALKLPVLESGGGAWFGALNICRELARCASGPLRIVWPEDLRERLAANAQELVLQGMASEVVLIMSGNDAAAYGDKARTSMLNSLAWLDAQLPGVLRSLPAERSLSFLEISSFCFFTHLEFRSIADTSSYANLRAFCQAYGNRSSARDTTYRFDQP
ncbi:MAG TPA: glutathione S-transferase N-terminal domain-containing protein [Polyangiales bacterium]|nr:glutathione S-transferase N-terminal domain-containing protein [Polyangiales bacterium]